MSLDRIGVEALRYSSLLRIQRLAIIFVALQYCSRTNGALPLSTEIPTKKILLVKMIDSWNMPQECIQLVSLFFSRWPSDRACLAEIRSADAFLIPCPNHFVRDETKCPLALDIPLCLTGLAVT